MEPGDTVDFVAVSPDHAATAYHGQHVKPHRVPDGVFAIAGVLLNLPELASSRIVELGSLPWSDLHEQAAAAGLP